MNNGRIITMIPNSTMYKLVNSDGIVIAEGSSKDMQRLRKKQLIAVCGILQALKLETMLINQSIHF